MPASISEPQKRGMERDDEPWGAYPCWQPKRVGRGRVRAGSASCCSPGPELPAFIRTDPLPQKAEGPPRCTRCNDTGSDPSLAPHPRHFLRQPLISTRDASLPGKSLPRFSSASPRAGGAGAGGCCSTRSCQGRWHQLLLLLASNGACRCPKRLEGQLRIGQPRRGQRGGGQRRGEMGWEPLRLLACS